MYSQLLVAKKYKSLIKSNQMWKKIIKELTSAIPKPPPPNLHLSAVGTGVESRRPALASGTTHIFHFQFFISTLNPYLCGLI